MIIPTKQNITDFYKQYYLTDSNSFQLMYKAIAQLVNAFPSHKKIDHILPKAIVINQLYSTNIMAISRMANHIISTNLSSKLK